jgi:hypothetical protein
MKIIQIGFNRCGTSTLNHFLKKNGIATVHWDEGRLAQRMFANRAQGKRLLEGYENFQAFTDMEFIDGNVYLEAYKLFRDLAAQYPDAVFVLNTRDRQAWIESRLRHLRGRYAAMQRQYYKVDSDEALVERWRTEWNLHHRDVREFFSNGTYRFLEWPIENYLPRLLSENVPEFSFDERLYARRHASAGKDRSLAGRVKRLARQTLGLRSRAYSALKQWSGSLFSEKRRSRCKTL